MFENNVSGLEKILSELTDIEKILLEEFRDQVFEKVPDKTDREWLGN